MTALYLPLGRTASRTISTRFATVRRAPMPLTGVSAEFCGRVARSRSHFVHLRDFFLPGFQQSAGHRGSSYPRAETAGSSPGRRPSAKNLRVPAPCGAPALRIPKSQPFLPGWDLGILSEKGGPMAGTRVF